MKFYVIVRNLSLKIIFNFFLLLAASCVPVARRLQYNGECTLCTVYSNYLSLPWTDSPTSAPLEKQRRFCALS
jgi:hypothetical protein